MKFMDFCAGIGGGRLGLEKNRFECVAHSEINNVANCTYRVFFGTKERNFGDLMSVDVGELPDFDILIAGFPCQTFSIVGKREGFEDSRGQVIYGLIRILNEKNVPYFILENVKGLVNHNKGETIKTIINELSAIGYYVDYKVLNSENYGVPQMRERVYIIGIKSNLMKKTYEWPKPVKTPDIRKYLIDNDNEILDFDNPTWQKYINNKYNKGRFDFEKILCEDYLVLDWRQSDLRIYRNKVPTLRTGRHGILYVKDGKLRKLSGYEALLLQGFPKKLANKSKKTKIDNTKLLSQAGNAMTVPVIKALGKSFLQCEKEDKANDLVKKGSKTAKDGFKTEREVKDKLNNWQNFSEAKAWLSVMGHNPDDIKRVDAQILSGFKTDVLITIELKNQTKNENVQVKLVSGKSGYNQVDKRWLSRYREMWDIPDDVYEILEYFTGEKPPYKIGTKYSNRMLITEMEEEKQSVLINWLTENKMRILTDIIKGDGEFSAKWVLVIQKTNKIYRWTIKSVDELIDYYMGCDIKISSRGSISFGKITIQRKGGDNGKPTANMLQFKLDPTSLF